MAENNYFDEINYNQKNHMKTMIDGYYDYESEFRGEVHDQSEFEYDGRKINNIKYENKLKIN